MMWITLRAIYVKGTKTTNHGRRSSDRDLKPRLAANTKYDSSSLN